VLFYIYQYNIVHVIFFQFLYQRN